MRAGAGFLPSTECERLLLLLAACVTVSAEMPVAAEAGSEGVESGWIRGVEVEIWNPVPRPISCCSFCSKLPALVGWDGETAVGGKVKSCRSLGVVWFSRVGERSCDESSSACAG